MDINAGAQLICKRSVLEDAKLANTTLAIALSKTTVAEPTITLNADGHITAFHIPAGQYNDNGKTTYYPTKFTIRPVMISVDDNTPVPDLTIEGKEYYRRHKSDIITSILSGSVLMVMI